MVKKAVAKKSDRKKHSEYTIMCPHCSRVVNIWENE